MNLHSDFLNNDKADRAQLHDFASVERQMPGLATRPGLRRVAGESLHLAGSTSPPDMTGRSGPARPTLGVCRHQ